MNNREAGDWWRRFVEFARCVAALFWAYIASNLAGRAAAGISGHLGLSYGQTLLESAFLLFLVVVGYEGLAWSARRAGVEAVPLPLPRRKTSLEEWGTGVAVGWAICLAVVLPLLLARDLHASVNRGTGMIPAVLTAVVTLLLICLAEEAIFRGYPFQRLMSAVGSSVASLLMSVLFGVVLLRHVPSTGFGLALLDGAVFGLLLAIAYLRTHGLWLGWGIHVGYRVVMAVILGLPIAGRGDFSYFISATTTGPVWLSGGNFGLDGSLPALVCMLVGMVLVYKLTRDWAWSYTQPEIKPGGYEVVVAPPAAHLAMEKAAAPPPLVQIVPLTPQGFSAVPPPPVPASPKPPENAE